MTTQNTTVKPVFKDGTPECSQCGSSQFKVGFKETIYRRLNATEGSEGWGEGEPCEFGERDPIIGVVCSECDYDIEVTPELEAFIRKIE